jgi:hypothetical protein
MRYRVLVLTAAWTVLPAFAQQPGLTSGTQGIVNEQAIKNAVRNALQKSLNIQGAVPAGSRLPSRFTVQKRVLASPPPPRAVPLLPVPPGEGGDDAIFLKRGIGTPDNGMILAPRTPPCSASAR